MHNACVYKKCAWCCDAFSRGVLGSPGWISTESARSVHDVVELVRVSTSKQETQRQHDDLDPTCVRVFEEKISGTLELADRPGLQAALDYVRPGDMLTVQEADRLGRNLLEGLIVLNDLFQQGIAVKILHGIAAGEHTERSPILDLALAVMRETVSLDTDAP